MSVSLNSVESSLNSAFKNAPSLPEKGKKNLVQWLPWINVVVGALLVWSAYELYHWGHAVNKAIDFLNSLYSGTAVGKNRLTAGIWLGVALLAVEGVLFLVSYPAVKARKKSGWNLVLYASLLNVAYAVVILFTDYGSAGHFILSLASSAVTLYLLFQIRSSFSA